MSDPDVWAKIVPDDDKWIVQPDGNLLIRNIELTDAALYTCFKNNADEGSYLIEIERVEQRKQVRTVLEGCIFGFPKLDLTIYIFTFT